jgi:hypothetical protein
VKLVLMTHDLTCALAELIREAANYPRGKLSALPSLPRGLAVAAVGFIIQLAIDQTGRDPKDLRDLESDLIARLEPAEDRP